MHVHSDIATSTAENYIMHKNDFFLDFYNSKYCTNPQTH